MADLAHRWTFKYYDGLTHRFVHRPSCRQLLRGLGEFGLRYLLWQEAGDS